MIAGIAKDVSKNYFVDIMSMEIQEADALSQEKISLEPWLSDITNGVTEQWVYVPEIKEYVLIHADNTVEFISEAALQTKENVKEETFMFDSTKIDEYRLMRNPIDDYFLEKLNRASCYAEIRDYEYFYLVVWQREYEKIMAIMQERCVMNEDKERLQTFMEEVSESFEKMKPFIEGEILNNFEYPESPEKYSYGNSTIATLNMYEGMHYRNACMLFTNSMYLTGYQFPTKEEIDLFIVEQK